MLIVHNRLPTGTADGNVPLEYYILYTTVKMRVNSVWTFDINPQYTYANAITKIIETQTAIKCTGLHY